MVTEDEPVQISSIMTKEVVTVKMDDFLRTIHRIFENVKFHHVLVIEDNELYGVISDRDILKAISPYVGTPSQLLRDEATMDKRAHQIMSRHPVTIAKEQSVDEAIALLLKENVSCLPVISLDGHIEGIVTWKDLIKSYLHQ